MELLLTAAVGLFAGFVVGWLLAQTRERSRAEALVRDNARLAAELEGAAKAAAEQRVLMEDSQKRLAEAFDGLAHKALSENNRSFLELARESLGKVQERMVGELESKRSAVEGIVSPLKSSLERLDRQFQDMGKTQSQVSAQIEQIARSSDALRKETGQLVSALRKPEVRGRWGELQLRNAVEIAQMSPYCDFLEQQTMSGEDGAVLRPDMIVRLPNERVLVVDSKAVLDPFLDAVSAETEEARAAKMREHAASLRRRIDEISLKKYWEQFENTPEFVVLFLPGESFFSAALETDPALLDDAMRRKVILATPTTLVALLKAVAYGWRQETMAKEARKIAEVARELYQRLATWAEKMTGVGKSLDGAVRTYNEAVGSLESRVLVSARKMKEMGLDSDKEVPEAKQVERGVRELKTPDTE